MNDVWLKLGITVVGIVAAALILSIITNSMRRRKEKVDKELIYNWLKNNTGGNSPKRLIFRSTRTISSNVNLSVDRVAGLCSIDKRIFRSTGEKDDMWGLRECQP